MSNMWQNFTSSSQCLNRSIYIPNECLENSKFPSGIKCAELSPSFEKTGNFFKHNYRPIRILTAIYQIYTKVLWTSNYIHISNTHSMNHWAFFTTTNIADNPTWNSLTTEKPLRIVTNLSDQFLCTSPKAFDYFPHSLIIAKLHACGLVLTHLNLCLVL